MLEKGAKVAVVYLCERLLNQRLQTEHGDCRTRLEPAECDEFERIRDAVFGRVRSGGVLGMRHKRIFTSPDGKEAGSFITQIQGRIKDVGIRAPRLVSLSGGRVGTPDFERPMSVAAKVRLQARKSERHPARLEKNSDRALVCESSDR